METKLFLESEVEDVFQFEKARLSGHLSQIEVEMKSWDGPWREESLRHYSKLGWSFISIEDNKIIGYVLAQPVLFFNNWTQTLWVEHISYDRPQVGQELLDVVVRWAKTKHLQKVVVNNHREKNSHVVDWFPKFQGGDFLHLSTTKLQED